MFRLVFRVFPVAAMAGLLVACSAMPEWTKPSTWIDGATETKETAKPEEAKTEKTEVANTSGETLPPVEDPLAPEVVRPRIKPTDKATEFPNLAAQPAPREPTTTESQKREIRDSLVADRDRAQYSADELRGGAQPAAAPPPPSPKPATPVEQKPKDEDE